MLRADASKQVSRTKLIYRYPVHHLPWHESVSRDIQWHILQCSKRFISVPDWPGNKWPFSPSVSAAILTKGQKLKFACVLNGIVAVSHWWPLSHQLNGEIILARAAALQSVAARRSTGNNAVATISAVIFHSIPFYPFFFVATFSHRRSTPIKKLI